MKNLFGSDDIPPAASFERKSTGSGASFWQEIDFNRRQIPECHPHDEAWVCSILHGIATKSLGQVFEPMGFTLGNQQIKALCEKYSKYYINRVDQLTCQNRFNIARKEANLKLRAAAENFANRK